MTVNANLNALPILTEVLESCAGCGACCLEQGAPPDYVALALNEHFFDDPSFAEDAQRYRMLPQEARQRLDLYLQKSAAGEIPKNGACVWYQADSQSCGFYDFRPSTCRVFERSSPGCHIYRQRHWAELNADGVSGHSDDISGANFGSPRIMTLPEILRPPVENEATAIDILKG